MALAGAGINGYIWSRMFKLDKNLLIYKLPALMFAALIIFVSTRTNVSPPSLGVDWSDKIYHFGEYFVYAFLIFRAFPQVHRSPQRTSLYVLLFLFGIAFGGFDERVQYYIPNRDSSPFDWMADSIGYCTAGVLFVWYRTWRARHVRMQDA